MESAPTLAGLNWRVDVQAGSRHGTSQDHDQNTPIAILTLQLSQGEGKPARNVQVQLDRATVRNMASDMKHILKVISHHSELA
mmetsp:Transcript_27370/g.52113  ORF Transcript_27370/g.52113 Transcript_27370/m.52113 type:complete len:83 (+) Transcript_27370:242-490(+)